VCVSLVMHPRLDDHAVALERLRALAGELDRSHPGAAASLREGLEETLTLQRLGIRSSLKTTLASTNPCESMIECVRRTYSVRNLWGSKIPIRHRNQSFRALHAITRP
jgi:putative transposase